MLPGSPLLPAGAPLTRTHTGCSSVLSSSPQLASPCTPAWSSQAERELCAVHAVGGGGRRGGAGVQNPSLAPTTSQQVLFRECGSGCQSVGGRGSPSPQSSCSPGFHLGHLSRSTRAEPMAPCCAGPIIPTTDSSGETLQLPPSIPEL